jgi:hypothetical protein
MASSQSYRYLGAFLFALLGARAGHWFITPMRHPDATTLRSALVALQFVVGLGGAIWLLRAERARESDVPAS